MPIVAGVAAIVVTPVIMLPTLAMGVVPAVAMIVRFVVSDRQMAMDRHPIVVAMIVVVKVMRLGGEADAEQGKARQRCGQTSEPARAARGVDMLHESLRSAPEAHS